MTAGHPPSPPTTSRLQGEFFDDHLPLYPWPKLLRSAGLRRVYKPREAMWKLAFERLGLQPGDKVLDVGCGTGIWLDRLGQEFGTDGVGIDVSTRSLQVAVSNSLDDLKFLCGDILSLPFPAGVFDAVLSLDVLEHVVDQDQCLHEMVRVLKPGGRLLLWTLNRNQRYTWNWWLDKTGIDVFERVAHDPARFPDVCEVRDHLKSGGMVIETLELFNSFFTLAMDEAIMVIVSVLDRLNLFSSEYRLARYLGRGFLAVTDILSRRLLGILRKLDQPWVERGYSNGFLVVARKGGRKCNKTSQ